MKKRYLLGFLGLVLFAVIAFAKTEDSTSIAGPVSLYGTYNGALVPLKVDSDGTLAIQ